MMTSVSPTGCGGNSSLAPDQQPHFIGQGRGLAYFQARMLAPQIGLRPLNIRISRKHAFSGADMRAGGVSV